MKKCCSENQDSEGKGRKKVTRDCEEERRHPKGKAIFMRQGRAEEDIGKNCQAEKRSDKPD